MKASNLIFLLLICFIVSTCSFPSKPLNERSTELTWQAWLLIDESQNKQDNSLRRRITPKSVFIAPTFSPESLPACSEGYQSDSMGRCIKIIMLNKELHLDFLLQQLNQKFGGLEDYEDDDGTTSGPLNINIPLNQDADEGTDVAIVVAPANGLMQSENEMKVNMNKTLSEEKVNVADIAGILGLKQAADVETTTIYSDSTTQTSTVRDLETTTMNDGTTELNALFFLDPKRQVEVKTETNDYSTTSFSTTQDVEKYETETMGTTTEFKRETTERRSELLFLQMDQALPISDSTVTFSDVKREVIKSKKPPITDFNPLKFNFPVDPRHTTMKSVVLTPIDNALSNQESPSTTSTESFFSIGIKKPNYETLYKDQNKKFFTSFTEAPNLKTSFEVSSELPTTTTEMYTTTTTEEAVTIITPGTEFEVVSTEPPKTTEPYRGDVDEEIRFKFPSSSHFVRFPSDRIHSDSKPIEAVVSLQSNDQREIFRGTPMTTLSEQDVSHALYERFRAHRENHRNRDKHSEWFHLPPKWSDISQKPVVLRFSRKQGYIDTQQLGSHNFYREINPRLFGFPAKSGIHR